MKYVTIDIEADSNSKLCRELFKNNNHRDPNNRIWIYTLSYYNNGNLKSISKICKLPSKARIAVGDNGIMKSTGVYHEENTKVNPELFSSKIIEYTDYTQFINTLYSDISLIHHYNMPLYYFGWYNSYKNIHDDYDYEVIKKIFIDNNLPVDELDCMKNVNRLYNIRKPFTQNQTKSGTYVSNQIYFNNGIQHNIEDAEFLANEIVKKM